MTGTTDLAQRKCVACEGDVAPFNKIEAEVLLNELNSNPDASGSGPRQLRSSGVNGWSLNDDGAWLSKEFKFKNFAEALAFVDKVGAIAEEEGHHPDIELGWGRVLIKLTTHAINGLSENDFIVAAKIDTL